MFLGTDVACSSSALSSISVCEYVSIYLLIALLLLRTFSICVLVNISAGGVCKRAMAGP